MLVLQEGLVLEGARHYCSGERCYVATDTEVGSSLHPHSHALGGGLFLRQRERRAEPTTSASFPRGCPVPALGITHLCPKTVVAETRNQRSVTLFSRAAAICCKRKASCIFWAAGSSSRALMILS